MTKAVFPSKEFTLRNDQREQNIDFEVLLRIQIRKWDSLVFTPATMTIILSGPHYQTEVTILLEKLSMTLFLSKTDKLRT